MKKLEITKGEWKSTFNTSNERGVRSSGGFICFLPKPTRYTGQDQRYEEEMELNKNDAALIADAGNTYQQCELLPSELLELYRAATDATIAKEKAKQEVIKQRDDLLEACSELLGLLKFHGYEHATEIYKANEALKTPKP